MRRGSGRRLAAVAVAVVLAVLTLAGAPIAGADSVDDRKSTVDEQIAQLRDSLEGANADFVEAAVALERARLRLADAQATLHLAQAALASANARDVLLTGQLAFAQAQQGKALREQGAQTQAQQQTRQTLGQIAREAYTGSDLSSLSIVLQAQSPDQFSEGLAVAGAALRAQSGALDRYAVEAAQLRAHAAKLDAIAAQVQELKRQSAIVVTQRAAATASAAVAATAVSRLVTIEGQAVGAIQSKIAAERQRLDALGAEQTRLKAILVARAAADAARRRALSAAGGGSGGGGGAPTAGSGFLSHPANGPITSGFGMRYHPILHIYRMHTGIDFGIACGTPVYAAAGGDVIQAGAAGGYGNRIVIDHGLVRGVDLATTYNHLSRIVVGGGTVARGQLIAYSGTTGLSTGCHLHFETLVDGDFVDPMGWL